VHTPNRDDNRTRRLPLGSPGNRFRQQGTRFGRTLQVPCVEHGHNLAHVDHDLPAKMDEHLPFR
jgi:hypothetical protein